MADVEVQLLWEQALVAQNVPCGNVSPPNQRLKTCARKADILQCFPPPTWRRSEVVVRVPVNSKYERNGDMKRGPRLKNAMSFRKCMPSIIDMLQRIKANRCIEHIFVNWKIPIGIDQERGFDARVDVDRLHPGILRQKATVTRVLSTAHIQDVSLPPQLFQALVFQHAYR